MILLIYFLKHVIMMSDFKMKNWMTTKNSEELMPPMPELESDEEVKEGKRLKILTPDKVLTRLPELLVQTKAGNTSYKLQNQI